MGRLIDADDIEFKKKFCKRFCTNLADVTTCKRKENCGIMEWIENQPTAYDVDKVIELMESLKANNEDAGREIDKFIRNQHIDICISIVKGAVKDE